MVRWSSWAPDSGLYYYGARWYDPALARFVQADTVVPEPGDPQAWNKYSYVYNNPLNFVDPSGHQGETPTPTPPPPGMPPPPIPPVTPDGTPSPPTPEELWRRQVLWRLWNTGGTYGQWAVKYIIENNVQFTFNPNPWYATETGAQWTLAGDINIPRDPNGNLPDASDPWVLCLAAHEAYHLAQGAAVALSVVGEFRAFQFHHALYRTLTGEQKNDDWAAINQYDLDVNDDQSLRHAQELLVAASGTDHYRKYPLRPIFIVSILDIFRR